MKKLTAIIGICLIGCITQAQPSTSTASTPSASTSKQCQSAKHFNPQEILAKINEAISKRQAEEQKATGKGHADIAAALQKIITDLNAMKTAIGNTDKAGFKAANEQRKQDRKALRALLKGDRQSNKHGKNPGSTTTPASTVKP